MLVLRLIQKYALDPFLADFVIECLITIYRNRCILVKKRTTTTNKTNKNKNKNKNAHNNNNKTNPTRMQ